MRSLSLKGGRSRGRARDRGATHNRNVATPQQMMASPHHGICPVIASHAIQYTSEICNVKKFPVFIFLLYIVL